MIDVGNNMLIFVCVIDYKLVVVFVFDVIKDVVC